MKRNLNLFILFLLLFASCSGPSSMNEEKAIADSLRIIDSLTLIEQQMAIQQDTIQTQSTIEKEQKKIGEIKHLIKDTMQYGITDTVEVTISYKCPPQIINNEVHTFLRRNVVTQNIKITPQMRARLIDPTGNSFKITPITDTVQIVEMLDSTYTLWQWRVTPIKDGNKNLVLSVDMIIDNNKKSLKIYQNNIFIHIGFWTKLWNLIQLNWTYITYVITGLFAILAWLYKEKLIKFFKS